MHIRGGGRGRARPRTVLSDEIVATVIDHVIEAAQRVQPNLSRFSVTTIIGWKVQKKNGRELFFYLIFFSRCIFFIHCILVISKTTTLGWKNWPAVT